MNLDLQRMFANPPDDRIRDEAAAVADASERFEQAVDRFVMRYRSTTTDSLERPSPQLATFADLMQGVSDSQVAAGEACDWIGHPNVKAAKLTALAAQISQNAALLDLLGGR